jgi:hypothetical protein
MPSLINRVPPGLLSLLGIKAVGQNPTLLGDALTGFIDLTPLYTAGFAEIASAATSSVSSTGVSVIPQNLVPAGELWVVTRAAMFASANLAATTTYRLRLAVWDSIASRVVDCGPSVSAAAGERPATYIDGPFVMSPGEQIALICESVTLGTAQGFTISCKFSRLSI